jgi:hypothetical protein
MSLHSANEIETFWFVSNVSDDFTDPTKSRPVHRLSVATQASISFGNGVTRSVDTVPPFAESSSRKSAPADAR